MALGALLTVVGLVIAGTAPVVGTTPAERAVTQPTVGGVLTLAGWALLAWGIHRFGRNG